jgi:hypothetical protein
MTLSNFGTTGDAFFADNQPSFFSDGAFTNHLKSGGVWRGPFEVEDLAFRLVMVPEPASAGICFLCFCIATRPARKR